jgi:capsular polysaccharide biosynthesis protein
MLGIPESRILEHGVRADRLLSIVADGSDGVDRDFLLFAGENLLPEYPGDGSSGDRRVFISRAGAAHRRLLNEAECARVLEKSFGVELVTTERMSLREEIALFRRASLIVATHGAGLANIAFAPKGTGVIELASRTYWLPLFAEIAAAKEDRYAVLWGQPAKTHAETPAAEHDFVIDISEVERAVAVAVEQSAPRLT